MTPFSTISGFDILMFSMLAFATVSFTLLSMVTVSNAWRLRNPLISWNSGKLFGYPLFATIFFIFIAAVSVVLIQSERPGVLQWMLCYNWIAIVWMFSSYQLSKRYITDNGIVKNVNDPSQTVVWGNISDYIEKPTQGGSDFLFLYMLKGYDSGDKQMTRLELFVPETHLDSFKKILNYKLRRRFTEQTINVPGFQAFK
jgi:hypothetical protein